MTSNVKIPASYNSRNIFDKARAKFIKGIRSNIERAISSQLREAYKDKGTPEVQGNLLSPVAKYNMCRERV